MRQSPQEARRNLVRPVPLRQNQDSKSTLSTLTNALYQRSAWQCRPCRDKGMLYSQGQV